jgi:hypothetical protein
MPGGEGGSEEERVKESGVFKVETNGMRDIGGDGDKARRVIRHGAREGGEGGVRKGSIPSGVKESPI